MTQLMKEKSMPTTMKRAALVKAAEKPLPTAEYVLVTPSQAQLWLDIAAKNRKLNQARIAKYADAMTRGDWLITSQGIAFDEQGALTDGQHRLHAIVKSQVSVMMLVVTTLPNKSQMVLDQGYLRQAHDQIALREGWKVFPIHTAIAKAMIKSVGGEGHRQRQLDVRDVQLLNRYYVKHHKAIEFVVAQTFDKYKLPGVLIAPSLAPIARAYYTVDINLLTRFCEILSIGMSGEGIGSKDTAAVVLRNWLLAGRDKGLSARAYGDRFAIYKKTEVALRAFVNGESIQRLGQMSTDIELFPLPNESVLKVAK